MKDVKGQQAGECQAEPKTEELKSQLEAREAEIKELTDSLQRLQAEFDNYRKRQDREIEEKKHKIKAEIIQKLLPVLDSFEQAFKNHDESIDGWERIYAQLMDTFEQEGLKAITTKGKFDPHQHEVLLVEPSEQEEGTIIQELQRGYTYYGQIIRTSKVKISKK